MVSLRTWRPGLSRLFTTHWIADTMKLFPLALCGFLLGLTTSCDRATTAAPPCPADGRLVTIYVHDDPTKGSKGIDGMLAAWKDGWASLRKKGILIHIPVARVITIHESN